MTRAERAAEAARLKAEGLNGVQIAERMGISRPYAYDLLKDPDGSGVRARKASYGGACIDCGKRTDGSNGRRNAPKRCNRCQRSRNVERDARILEAWNRGDTGEAIAKREGVTYPTVCGVVDHSRQRLGLEVRLHRRRNRELWPLIERRWLEGATGPEIAVECGTTEHNIWVQVQGMRAAGTDLPQRAGPYPEDIRRDAVRLYAAGRSTQAVGTALGVTGESVRRWVHEAGVPIRPRSTRPGVAA